MKKIFTLFAAMVCAAGMFAASYGIAVNGKTYYAGTENPTPGDPSFQEFMVLGLSLSAGDQLQLWDPNGNDGQGAGWAVNLDGASTSKISRDGDHYVCNEAACFDFYIKLQYGNDQLYVGEGQCGSPEGTEISGGGDPVTPPVNPGVEGNPRYYYKGYIDGQDVEPSEETIFDHGLAELEVSSDAYLFVLYQVDGYPGVQYMTASYVDGPTHATLLSNGGEKFHVGAGSYTLYLYDNEDGTLEISTQVIPGKKLADPQPVQQGIEDVEANVKAHKVFIDGQLRIVRGDKVFDVTGRQL